jgi:hypothetical protein
MNNMNNMRNVLCFLMATMLAAFALPGIAGTTPEKIFSLMVPNTVPATGGSVTVTITNQTPTGNSTINSFMIIPPAGVTISPPYSSVASATTFALDPATGGLRVSGFSGLRPLDNVGIHSINVTFSVNVTSATQPCSMTWNAQAFTGNSLNGDTFRLLPAPPSSLTTSVTGACKYSLNMSPAPPVGVNQNSPAVSMSATFTNPSLNGMAFSALTLAAQSGLTIATATLPAGTTGTMTSLPGGSVSITNISPAVQPGSQLVLSLTVNVAPSCMSPFSTVSWGAMVYAGPALSGIQFTPNLASSSLMTRILAPPCQLNFTPNPPKNGIVNQILPPVTVTLSGGSASGTVSLTSNCSLSGTTSVAASGGSATFSNLVISNAATSCTLTAMAPGYGQATSSPFTVFAGGPLRCYPFNPFEFSNILPPGVDNISQPGYAAGHRGQYNKDGSQCDPVGYTFTNDILNTNSVNLTWDVASQKGATFQYTVTWKPEYVSLATGLPTRVTKVAWYDDATGTILGPVVPGRACLSPELPFPYGTLGQPIAVSDTQITVNSPALPPLPTPPFPIVIDNERMTVTNVAGTLWTVDRGVGGTTAATHSTVYPDLTTAKNVMSTPLPLDGSSIQMRMCIASEAWETVAPGANDCPTAVTPSPTVPVPTAPLACVLYSTTIFDIGDGFVIRAP